MAAIDLLYMDADVSTTVKEDKPSGTIYEWYTWSYFNTIFGCLILGFIAIFLSLRTTMHKEAENNVKARIWSYITLLWNILATSTGISLTLYAIFK
jgi:hypothetical protein